MKKFLIYSSTLLISLLSLNVLANPPAGVGHGFGNSKAIHSSFIGDNLPPGLRGKDYPHGLSKQVKTPYGWSQGKKKGWYKIDNKVYYFNGRKLFLPED